MFDLTGKTALITGASGGLGGAIARALHDRGAVVGLSGTRREALAALAAELETDAHVFPCDLSHKSATEALVPAAEAAMGSVDILVNNAGVIRDNLIMRMKDEEWDSVLGVNLTAAFRLSRACLKGMLRKRHGRIIGVSSVIGVTGNAGQGNYAAAKAGMVGMYKSLAAEVASRNVTVNCIAPGFIENSDDPCLERETESGDPRNGTDGTPRNRRRSRRCGRLPGKFASLLCHRPNPPCKRWIGNDLNRIRGWRRVPRGPSPTALKYVTNTQAIRAAVRGRPHRVDACCGRRIVNKS